jgi:fucose 4-O-acetylase-like acetyltransferase
MPFPTPVNNQEQKINHLACWVTIVVVDIFLYVWYNFFFFKAWLANNNMTAETFVDNRGLIPYAISVLSTVIIVYLLAWILTNLKVDDFQSGMAIAVSIGFAFTFLNVLGRDLYLFRPFEISLIDGAASVFACIIAGGILGGWVQYETGGDN